MVNHNCHCNMNNLFPIQKQQEFPIFGSFNASYGEALFRYCSYLNRFPIEVFTIVQYQQCPVGFAPMVDDDTSAFSYSYNKEEDSDESIKAAVIIVPELINRIAFTEGEQFAAIAHEIGHIVLQFSEHQDQYQGPQAQEIYADGVACRIGLAEQMLSTLNKLEESGLFSDSISRFGMRKLMIETQYL